MGQIEEQINVLYLEEDPQILEAAVSVLSDYGFNVTGAISNEEALEVCHQKLPSCVLAAFHEGSSVGGPTFCYLMRENPDLRSVPIILVSDSLSSESIVVGLSSGANDIVLKETVVDILVLKIIGAAANMRVQQEVQELRRTAAIKSMIATYNHEINNPLTISMGHLRKLKKSCPEEGLKSLEAIEKGMARIKEIVKMISKIEESKEVDYAGGAKMIKLSSSEG